MLNRIFEFALENRFLVLVFVGLIIASGVYSMTILPIDAVPDVTPNQVQILTNAPGLGPVLACQPSRFISMKAWTSTFAGV